MKMWKKMAVVAMAAIATAMPASAQDDEGAVESYVDVDFVSHYMWRGQDKGGVSIQPEAYISWQGLTLKLDGSTGFESSDIKQVNVTLGYEIAGFNVGVIDRWVSGLDLNDRYFNFDKRGAHQLEANLGFSWKYGSLQAYTIFWGNDYRISGEHAYSTYVEFSVPFKLGGVNWKASVGGTPLRVPAIQSLSKCQPF